MFTRPILPHPIVRLRLRNDFSRVIGYWLTVFYRELELLGKDIGMIVTCLVAADVCSSHSRSLTDFREIDDELDAVRRYEVQTTADTEM